MITLLNENFAKEVKRVLKGKENREITVRYRVVDAAKCGTLSITVNDSEYVETTIRSSFDYISLTAQGKPVREIVFSVGSTDVVLDLIVNNHFLELYKNAYRQLFTDSNGVEYYISQIIFRNEKGKSAKINFLCNKNDNVIFIEE